MTTYESEGQQIIDDDRKDARRAAEMAHELRMSKANKRGWDPASAITSTIGIAVVMALIASHVTCSATKASERYRCIQLQQKAKAK